MSVSAMLLEGHSGRSGRAGARPSHSPLPLEGDAHLFWGGGEISRALSGSLRQELDAYGTGAFWED